MTLILGDNEAEKGTLIMRDMQNKHQEEISVDMVMQRLYSSTHPQDSPT
jgi:histidyl-tRNA synthetase